MRKLIILVAILAVALLAASPALAQDEPAVVADAKAKTATAGGAKVEGDKAGGAEAKKGKLIVEQGTLVAPAALLLVGGGLLARRLARFNRPE